MRPCLLVGTGVPLECWSIHELGPWFVDCWSVLCAERVRDLVLLWVCLVMGVALGLVAHLLSRIPADLPCCNAPLRMFCLSRSYM